MSEHAIPAQREPFAARLRRGALWVSFAFILLIPKLLGLRKDPRAWFAFRAALGLFGAALVVVPLGLWSGWFTAVIGLAIFLTAALLGPAKSETSLDAKKRELGALVIVNGGRYAQAGGEAARLFVGAECIWALDRRLHPLVVIPAAEIRAAAPPRRRRAGRCASSGRSTPPNFSTTEFSPSTSLESPNPPCAASCGPLCRSSSGARRWAGRYGAIRSNFSARISLFSGIIS